MYGLLNGAEVKLASSSKRVNFCVYIGHPQSQYEKYACIHLLSTATQEVLDINVRKTESAALTAHR